MSGFEPSFEPFSRIQVYNLDGIIHRAPTDDALVPPSDAPDGPVADDVTKTSRCLLSFLGQAC